MYTDDPIRDYYEHESENARWLANRPICYFCGEPIQDEYLYKIDDEKLVCEECLKEYYRRDTEDFCREG